MGLKARWKEFDGRKPFQKDYFLLKYLFLPGRQSLPQQHYPGQQNAGSYKHRDSTEDIVIRLTPSQRHEYLGPCSKTQVPGDFFSSRWLTMLESFPPRVETYGSIGFQGQVAL